MAIQLGTIVIVEMGYGTVRAGLSTDAVPTVSFAANPNWDNFTESIAQSIFSQVFTKLNVTPTNCSVVLSLPAYKSGTNSTTIAQVLMGSFKVKAMYCNNDTWMALYSQGKVQGISVFAENSNIVVDSYIDGYSTQRGMVVSGTNDRQLLVNTINKVIQLNDVDIRSMMYSTIYLFGSRFLNQQAVVTQLDTDLAALRSVDYKVQKINTPAGLEIAVWKGASMLATLSDLGDYCFSQADFLAGGASAIKGKMS